ncbi:MAG TPA: GTP cyclohydrolase [Betaproteobacteria bacterium]|nr:GTP cyclohydrolase [Betaproteobacteria bacterium]
MFIVSLNYVSALDQVDALLEGHIEFLNRQYEKKIFIASGRKVPRTGGVIFARAKNKEALNTILEQDPFYKKGVAEYEVTEFVPTMTLPEFANLNES